MLRVVFQDTPSRNRFEQFIEGNSFFGHLLLRMPGNPKVLTESLALYASENSTRIADIDLIHDTPSLLKAPHIAEAVLVQDGRAVLVLATSRKTTVVSPAGASSACHAAIPSERSG